MSIDSICPVWAEILTRQVVCVSNNYTNEIDTVIPLEFMKLYI